MIPSLTITPSRTDASQLCVYFHASAPGQNAQITKYPAFWTYDRREAELFVTCSTPHLGALDQLWQSRQFAALDRLFQEIENETLDRRRKEETGEPSSDLTTSARPSDGSTTG